MSRICLPKALGQTSSVCRTATTNLSCIRSLMLSAFHSAVDPADAGLILQRQVCHAVSAFHSDSCILLPTFWYVQHFNWLFPGILGDFGGTILGFILTFCCFLVSLLGSFWGVGRAGADLWYTRCRAHAGAISSLK